MLSGGSNCSDTPSTRAASVSSVSSAAVRILFSMAYPGYLRYFDATISALLDRGHEVELWFETIRKQPEGLEALVPHPALHLGGGFPKRADRWGRVAHGERHLTDYVRYLDPRFADATYLRTRAGEGIPRAFAALGHCATLPPAAVRAAVGSLTALESVLPRAPDIDAFVAERRPDVIVVTPLVTQASRTADLVASARAAGLPTAVCIASWDHLTTKGIMRIVPDRVFVWNDAQAREAVELHGVPEGRIRVTGAQPFDRWFSREPGRNREDFCSRVGVPADRPYLLFVGSTASISAPEAEKAFVRRWIEALRASGNESVRDAAVLVRPHPYNSEHWDEHDLADLERVAVYPRRGANPVDEQDRTDYFDSIFHSAAVVGINTSAMIESAVQGKPVLSVTSPDFSGTQGGTLHFKHLMPENGGFLRVADDLDEHVRQVAGVLAAPETVREELDRFLSSFVRPQGLDQPSTPRLVDGIEELADVVPADDRRGAVVSALSRIVLTGWLVVDSATDRRYQAKLIRERGRRVNRRLRRAAKRSGRPSRAVRRRAKALRRAGGYRLPLAWLLSASLRPLDTAGRVAALVLAAAGQRVGHVTVAVSDWIRPSTPIPRPRAVDDPEAPEQEESALEAAAVSEIASPSRLPFNRVR
jgi:hypothetical protein